MPNNIDKISKKDDKKLSSDSLKRLIIVFSIFVALAIMGTAFIFVYQSQINLLVGRYSDKITICENILDEKDCFSHYTCEPIFEPACPNCQDLIFKRCNQLSEKDLAQAKKQISICQATGGQWSRSRLGSFCFCQLGKAFNYNAGCIARQ